MEANMVRSALSVLVGLLVALVACEKKQAGAPPKAAAPAEALPASTFADDAALIRALRGGGYVLAVRHGHTDMTQKDYPDADVTDCAKQRNLDEDGRSQARVIGEAMKSLKLPISEVYSSPFCRTKETAELAFGRYTRNDACMGADEASIAPRKKLLGTRPPKGQNVVVVTHRHSMDKAAPPEATADMEEAAALVIIPKGESQFDVVHTIKFADWSRLAAAAKGME